MLLELVRMGARIPVQRTVLRELRASIVAHTRRGGVLFPPRRQRATVRDKFGRVTDLRREPLIGLFRGVCTQWTLVITSNSL